MPAITVQAFSKSAAHGLAISATGSRMRAVTFTGQSRIIISKIGAPLVPFSPIAPRITAATQLLADRV